MGIRFFQQRGGIRLLLAASLLSLLACFAMAPSLSSWLQTVLIVPILVKAQTSTPTPGASATTSYRPEFTVPDAATHGATLLANIDDPEVQPDTTLNSCYRI